jgi:hypothetical protein
MSLFRKLRFIIGGIVLVGYLAWLTFMTFAGDLPQESIATLWTYTGIALGAIAVLALIIWGVINMSLSPAERRRRKNAKNKKKE